MAVVAVVVVAVAVDVVDGAVDEEAVDEEAEAAGTDVDGVVVEREAVSEVVTGMATVVNPDLKALLKRNKLVKSARGQSNLMVGQMLE